LSLKDLTKGFVRLSDGKIFYEKCFNFFRIRPGQLGSAETVFSARKAKIAPFGLKNCIFCYFLHFLPELCA